MTKTKNINMSKKQCNATIPTIKELVEKHFRQNIDTESRERNLIYMRAIYYKLCHENTRHSLHKIGNYVNRNHATVINGIRTFDDVLLTQEPFYWVESYNALDLIVKDRLRDVDTRVETLRELYTESIKENLMLRAKLEEMSEFKSEKTMI